MKQQDWKQMGHTILNTISFLLTWTFICYKDKTQNQTLNQLHSNPTTPVSITGKMVSGDRWAERFLIRPGIARDPSQLYRLFFFT